MRPTSDDDKPKDEPEFSSQGHLCSPDGAVRHGDYGIQMMQLNVVGRGSDK